jgi:hypothetical protein
MRRRAFQLGLAVLTSMAVAVIARRSDPRGPARERARARVPDR